MDRLDNYISIVVCVGFIARGMWLSYQMWRRAHILSTFRCIAVFALLASVIGQVIFVLGVQIDNQLYEWIGHLMRVALAAYITTDLSKERHA